MVIHKRPYFENDSMMFVIEKTDKLNNTFDLFTQAYYETKRKMFANQIIDKTLLEPYVDRASLRDILRQEDVSGSIYTYTCQEKNRLDYAHIIKTCKVRHRLNRKCAINFADTLYDYTSVHKNTSCLNSIHFCDDNVTLYFRASDVTNELNVDLLLIKEFFIDPVGEFKTITVMASTAQNIHFSLTNLINLIHTL